MEGPAPARAARHAGGAARAAGRAGATPPKSRPDTACVGRGVATLRGASAACTLAPVGRTPTAWSGQRWPGHDDHLRQPGSRLCAARSARPSAPGTGRGSASGSAGRPAATARVVFRYSRRWARVRPDGLRGRRRAAPWPGGPGPVFKSTEVHGDAAAAAAQRSATSPRRTSSGTCWVCGHENRRLRAHELHRRRPHRHRVEVRQPARRRSGACAARCSPRDDVRGAPGDLPPTPSRNGPEDRLIAALQPGRRHPQPRYQPAPVAILLRPPATSALVIPLATSATRPAARPTPALRSRRALIAFPGPGTYDDHAARVRRGCADRLADRTALTLF